jgi:hypothetical protein
LNVGNLAIDVVIGRAYLDLDVIVEYDFAMYFLIHFVSPVIAAALRYAYAISFLLLA